MSFAPPAAAWPRAAWPGSGAAPGPGQAHVVLFPLGLPPRERPREEALLSPDELARAARFVLPLHRDRFVAGRSTLRRVLGSCLGTSPAAVELAQGVGGKPTLARGHRLRFNLSHSGELALLALALDRDVGVDLERVRPETPVEDMARRFFSSVEQEELLSLPREGRLAAFFVCWTRKEAVLKARGDGLSLPLDSFDVTVRPDRPPELRWTGFAPGEAARYSLLDLPEIPGFAACLAVEGAPPLLRCSALDRPPVG